MLLLNEVHELTRIFLRWALYNNVVVKEPSNVISFLVSKDLIDENKARAYLRGRIDLGNSTGGNR